MKTHDTKKTIAQMVGLCCTLLMASILLMPVAVAQPMTPPMQMPVPEIEITAIEFSNTDAIEGQEVTISITIENMNSTMAFDNITLSLYLDYEVVHNFTEISLDEAESATYEYVWDSESGTHNVSALLVINEMPLMDTQISEELIVGLGDVSTIIVALLAILLAILVIVAVPSVFAVIRK